MIRDRIISKEPRILRRLDRLGSFALPALLAISLVSFACTSRHVRLYHPETGATMQCRASGLGLGINWGESLVQSCTRQFESRGYVQEDDLTPSQRAQLERRGIIPKD
jgi:hypothetical protein